MSGERGQAHVFAVACIALAAVAVSGLVAAEARLVRATHGSRVAEAAAEAAGAFVVDQHLAFVRSIGRNDDERDPTPAELARFLSSAQLVSGAVAAGRELATVGRGPLPLSAAITDGGRELRVELAFDDGSRQLVTFEKVACCRP